MGWGARGRGKQYRSPYRKLVMSCLSTQKQSDGFPRSGNLVCHAILRRVERAENSGNMPLPPTWVEPGAGRNIGSATVYPSSDWCILHIDNSSLYSSSMVGSWQKNKFAIGGTLIMILQCCRWDLHRPPLFDKPAGGDGASTYSSTKFGGTSKGKLNPKDFIFSRKQKEVRLGKICGKTTCREQGPNATRNI